ncbi:MAG TPA: hypothetical protein VG455_03785, partial [Acidimicrobiales bacterium]|nr:hypothetical protein [Acidimicrobiales bacterium]
MARVVVRSTVTGGELEDVLRPRTDLVRERDVGDHCFEAVEGPVHDYRRAVEVTPLDDGRAAVTQTVDFTLAVPYFWWLFLPPFKRALA